MTRNGAFWLVQLTGIAVGLVGLYLLAGVAWTLLVGGAFVLAAGIAAELAGSRRPSAVDGQNTKVEAA